MIMLWLILVVRTIICDNYHYQGWTGGAQVVGYLRVEEEKVVGHGWDCTSRAEDGD
jgi:hypothetical protein